MSNYANAKAYIDTQVYSNHANQVTAPMVNNAIKKVIDTIIAGGYLYKGIAHPGDAAVTSDANIFYIATEAGTYTNKGGLVVADGEVAVLKYNGSWSKEVTGAATAAQVSALGHEVGELETDVANIEDVLDGYEWQDAIPTTFATSYIYAKDNANLGTIIWNTNFRYSDYIDLLDAKKIRISCASDTAAGQDKGMVFYDANKVALVGYVYADSTDNNDTREVAVPTGAKYIRTTLNKNVAGDFVCQLLRPGDSLAEQIASKATPSDIERLDAEIMAQDRVSTIAVDLMQLVHSKNEINSTSYLSVVSATETSITLSAADAAYFQASPKYGQVAAVGFSDGTYKAVYFGAPSGNTIPRAAWETTDLSSATSVQSLHDTSPGGNGQHLSPSGYIAMGKFVADEIIKKTSLIDRNWIGGLVFNTLGLSKGYQDTEANNAVYDLDDNVVCRPVFYNWMWGGYTPNGNNTPNTRGNISNGELQSANGWVVKAYRITQGKKDAYIEFPISVSGKGIVEIQAAKLAYFAACIGDCEMTLYADGELVGTQTLVQSQTKYIWENVTIAKEMRVRFTLLANTDTDVAIYSIGFWKIYPSVPAPIVDGVTKIAVLGDSWTQFPHINQGLSDHADWNTAVTRPDGTTGDGYGYFPKALAQFTGAQVDNWGKSDMRADNWGLVKINDVLEHAKYDYLIVEFFINDLNAGISLETWLANIKRICDKCKQFGTRPVFVMPCGTNGTPQTASLGIWHEAVVKGLGVV